MPGENTAWTLPKFNFQVTIDGKNLSFQEVSGLDTETQTIEYQSGNSKMFSPIKMPGIAKTGTVTLKRGTAPNDGTLLNRLSAAKMNTIKHTTVTIALLDETGKPTMTWRLQNAWPTKITGTDLKSDGNEVAIETLELAHEGLTISNA